ncbi:MAG: hypothetical protein H0X38_07445 [Planctomycetes bacterium]|nr:hypothetical protein [Planctomycetota bacterium]
MAAIVYLLCALTSSACALLLYRGYRSTRTALLMWSGWCFAGLTLTNGVLFIDMIMLPGTDLRLVRDALSLASVLVLLVGLIWRRDD